jgi:hypothetical protein
MLAHFAGKVGKDQVSILVIQFHPEHGVGQGFPDNSFDFYRFFFCHKNSLKMCFTGLKPGFNPKNRRNAEKTTGF